MASYKVDGLEIKTGNSKLGTDTLIFNMGTAKDCPSKALGLCAVCDDCYALAPEKQYPSVIPYRERQEDYWKACTAPEFITALDKVLHKNFDGKPLHRSINHFRFNEAGDFWSQACVAKLHVIAHHLMKAYQITTYGYTARADLDFSRVIFLVKGSDNDAGNNGRTRVINHRSERAKGEVVCPGSCKNCDFCKTDDAYNVAFILH